MAYRGSSLESVVNTFIDNKPFEWTVSGDLAWGNGGPLCHSEDDPVARRLGDCGYTVAEMPSGCAELAAERVAAILGFNETASLETYHLQATTESHQRVIQQTRELRFMDLGIDPNLFTSFFSDALGLPLSATIPVLGRDHIQLRINRPGSTDFNPPHRDAALPVWANSMNVWIPIAGVDHRTSLPIIPGSHNFAESDCWQTGPGGAVIGGNRYRVPAITNLRGSPLQMIRTGVKFGQALIFTPYLIHGLAANQSIDRTRLALELRFEVLRSSSPN